MLFTPAQHDLPSPVRLLCLLNPFLFYPQNWGQQQFFAVKLFRSRCHLRLSKTCSREKSDFDMKLRISTCFAKPLFEVKKFYAWKCVNSRHNCLRQLFRVPIGKFYTWLNIFTQPAVVMVVTNMRCYQHFRLRKYILIGLYLRCGWVVDPLTKIFIEIKHLLFVWHFLGILIFLLFCCLFSCPGQLNKWHCQSVCRSEPTNNQSLGSIKEWP